METFKKAVKECGLAAALSSAFSLFAVALFAVFVRAYAPSDTTIAVVDRVILAFGVFLFSLLFVHRERALFKGAAAGLLSLLITTIVFGCIGGFHFTPMFLIEVLLCALFGGLGALLGVKLRKE